MDVDDARRGGYDTLPIFVVCQSADMRDMLVLRRLVCSPVLLPHPLCCSAVESIIPQSPESAAVSLCAAGRKREKGTWRHSRVKVGWLGGGGGGEKKTGCARFLTYSYSVKGQRSRTRYANLFFGLDFPIAWSNSYGDRTLDDIPDYSGFLVFLLYKYIACAPISSLTLRQHSSLTLRCLYSSIIVTVIVVCCV